MNSETVHVDLGSRGYDIVVAERALEHAGDFIVQWMTRRFSSPGSRYLIVTDTHVAVHAQTVALALRNSLRKDASVTTHVIPAGEASKSLAVISGMYDALVDLQADRKTVVIAVGGGVVGDAAGFAAASFARGIPFVQIPTTLLADVDSSVGGKVGINHPKAKNLIGAFHQPLGVLIDPAVLSTLPARDYFSGMAEVVKYGVILDAEFFVWLERNCNKLQSRDSAALQHAIARSCRLKADVVERDEYETTGLRAVLNYGHTFAHAFEALCGYGELTHGEAVSIGMVCASRLAEKCNRIDSRVTERQINLLRNLNLPVTLETADELNQNDVIDRMRLDKKTVGGQLRFILPAYLGHVELVNNVSEELVREVLWETGIGC